MQNLVAYFKMVIFTTLPERKYVYVLIRYAQTNVNYFALYKHK